ncbi:hypothetical protein [Streptomyces sp. NPDC001139]
MLFPGNDDVASPDVSWSYTGFSMFRKWLAQAEGFTLTEMNGFGGERQWRSVSTRWRHCSTIQTTAAPT